MPFATTNYGWTLPDAGAEPFSWEPFVRTAFQGIDTTMFSKFDKAGGNISGNVSVGGSILAGGVDTAEYGAGYGNIQVGGSSGGVVQAQTTGGVKMYMAAFSTIGRIGTQTNQPVALVVNNSEVLRVDTSANLGLGVTPCGHLPAGYGGPMAQVGGRATILGSATTAAYCNNVYYASGYFRYISDGAATMLEQIDGEFRLHRAAAGTAGQAISFVRPITLDGNNNFLVGATSSSGWGDCHRISRSGGQGLTVLMVDGGEEVSGLFLAVSGAGANTTDSALRLGKNTVTNRSINAGGTINASGADAAEYRKNNGLTIAKGQIVGYKNDGTLTLTWSQATMARVKSTDPHIVGGDNWGTEDKVGKRPEEPKFTPPQYTGRAKPEGLAPEPQAPAPLRVVTAGELNATSGRSISTGPINATAEDYAEYEAQGTALWEPLPPEDRADAVAAAIYALALKDYNVALRAHSDAVAAHARALTDWQAAAAQHAQDMAEWEEHQSQHDAAMWAAQQEFDDVTMPQYLADKAAFEDRLEAARQQVDRIAYCGIVPCNVTGATPGHYIVAAEGPNDTITGLSVIRPTEDQWPWVVGRCLRVLPDGRSEIDVMLS
jgi:hypothetical protein